MEKLLLCLILLKLFSLEVLADAHLPKPPYCGKSNLSSLRGRVFNGSPTGLDEYPWLGYLESKVLLFHKIPIGGGACTSSLITSNWVLTAAHCIFNLHVIKYPSLFTQSATVKLGEWDTTHSDPDCDRKNNMRVCAPNSIELRVAGAVVPPEFYNEKDGYDMNYDIALILLERNVHFSPYIQPICLPYHPIDNYEGRKVIVTGWGVYDKTGYPSQVKRKSTVTIRDIELCHEWYGEEQGLSEEHQLCVGGPDGGACRGDSGGPLLLQSPNENLYYQIGVASQGRQECVNISRPTTYTRVDTFIDWISDSIERYDYP